MNQISNIEIRCKYCGTEICWVYDGEKKESIISVDHKCIQTNPQTELTSSVLAKSAGVTKPRQS